MEKKKSVLRLAESKTKQEWSIRSASNQFYLWNPDIQRYNLIRSFLPPPLSPLSTIFRHVYANDAFQTSVVSTVPKRYDTWFIDELATSKGNERKDQVNVQIRGSEGKFLNDTSTLSDQPFVWTKIITAHLLPEFKRGSRGNEVSYYCAFFCSTKESKHCWLAVDDNSNLVLIPDKSGGLEKELRGLPFSPGEGRSKKLKVERMLWHVRAYEPKWDHLQSLLVAGIGDIHGFDMAEALRGTFSHSSDPLYAFTDVMALKH